MNRSRIVLYEFVPYGAPELLEVGRPYLTRALATSSSALVAVFLLALGASAWIAGHPGDRSIALPSIVSLMPPPSILEQPRVPTFVPQVQVTPPTAGVPVPVRDEQAPPDALILSQDELRNGPASDAPSGEPNILAVPREPVEATPTINDYVYYDEPPAVVTRVVPVYPDLARDAGVDGTVLLRVLVGRDGHVKDTHVDRGNPLLDEAAVAAARQWVFTPALSNGRPVMVWVAIPIRFSLH